MSNNWLYGMAASLQLRNGLHFDDLVQVGWWAYSENRNAYYAMIDYLRTMNKQEARTGSGRHSSLDTRPKFSAPETLGNSIYYLEDTALDPSDVVVARDEARRMIGRDREIMFLTAAGWTLDDVAKRYGITKSRVCQVRREMRDRLEAA